MSNWTYRFSFCPRWGMKCFIEKVKGGYFEKRCCPRRGMKCFWFDSEKYDIYDERCCPHRGMKCFATDKPV